MTQELFDLRNLLQELGQFGNKALEALRKEESLRELMSKLQLTIGGLRTVAYFQNDLYVNEAVQKEVKTKIFSALEQAWDDEVSIRRQKE